MTETPRLRVLALHGFRGSGAALRRQMRSFSQGIATEVEFAFVDAPARADGVAGWWRALQYTEPSGTPAMRYDGWAASRDFIAEHCQREGPFDGVFGFSQGATLAGLLVALGTPSFHFAMLVGGFISADPGHAQLYEANRFQVPSMHVIGTTDQAVPAQRSRALAACFREPLILEHEAGHIVPSGSRIQEATVAFLREMRR